jgi:pimeloyl-ACP methyl ester carboxylesterase
MLKGYMGDEGAQIHYREIAPQLKTYNRPLLCLPPAPHSGSFFESVMPKLNQDRGVVAIDYPGYGGSDRGKAISIQAYAKALNSLMEAIGPVDLLGFHTGSLVAAEIVKLHTEQVGRVVMVDVPFFKEETRQSYISNLPQDVAPESVQESFEKSVINRSVAISKTRAFELWVEGLRSGAFKQDAFRAAFAYDAQAEFSRINNKISIIATQSDLLESSREAAKSIPQASLVEYPDISAPVFEAQTEVIAEAILAALTE